MSKEEKSDLFRIQTIMPKPTRIAFFIAILFILILIWLFNSNFFCIQRFQSVSTMLDLNNKIQFNHISKFSNNIEEFEKFQSLCYNNKQLQTIEDLSVFILLLKINKQRSCRQQYDLFHSIYQIRIKYTSIVIDDSFLIKIKKWLNNNAKLINAAKNQSLIFIDNVYTQESVIFNPVRANRPGTGAGDTKKYVDKLVAGTSKDCDFCLYNKSTAYDQFGRMESERTVIISNSFKIEKYHGMILFKNHNPIHFSQLQFIDSMDLALKWFKKTHSLVPSHNYRIMYWDILPKASASQVHPHLHLTLGDYAYYAKWNILYKAGLVFSKAHQNHNYWKSILQVHSTLGLTVRFGKASVMAYLTPQKDFEVLIISEKPCLDFFRLVFFTIRTFMDDLEQYSLSMGFVFPKLSTDFDYGEELPMLVRIVSRGPADSTRSDISSFDLFGTANVNKDPFKIVHKIREAVGKREKEEFDFPEWEH